MATKKPDDPEGISIPELRKAIQLAKRQEAALVEQVEILRAQVAAAKQERSLLEQLLRLRTTGVEEIGSPARAAISLEDAVVEILEGSAAPIHVGDIMERLDAQGVAIPGAGTQANLISRLVRDPRIVRPTRGYYGLASRGLVEQRSKSSKKKGRGRRGKVA